MVSRNAKVPENMTLMLIDDDGKSVGEIRFNKIEVIFYASKRKKAPK